MNVTDRWQRRLGIRSEEGRLVGLFFVHNFLLGVGTVLVYVAATAVLLENNPARHLPLAYAAAALAMMAAGRAYGYYEHRLPLQGLAGRALLAAVALTGGLGLLVATGESVGTAVALVAGYRVVYLLTSLEFWGVSAVVFDVRQGRRLFSVISAGDLPAKALGAAVAILVHRHTALLGLLGGAFGAFGGAWMALRATGRRHRVEPHSAPRPARAPSGRTGLQRWFGDSWLVRSLCLSLAAVAAVTTGVEYTFFVNVKHKFHDQAVVMQYVGGVLAATYLVAWGFKLLLSRLALDRLGIRWMLVALPLGGLAGLLGFGSLQLAGAGDTTLLAYFCGLYLLLEVLRRAVFDPVFLVLFQPLPADERLQAHTLVKGFYEPMGVALAGGLLLGARYGAPALSRGASFAWMGLLMAGALYWLHGAYGHYLAELQHALGQRFAAPGPADPLPGARPHALPGGAAETAALAAAPTAYLVDCLGTKAAHEQAADALVRRGDAALAALAAALRGEASDALVRRVAQVCGRLPGPAAHAVLVELARQPHRARRAAALRALRARPRTAADAPVFQALVQEELVLARALLHGQAASTDAALQRALAYELGLVQGRLFGLLALLYPTAIVADAQRSVAHATRERQANALEMLDNLIPRAWYQALQALLEPAAYHDQARVFDELLRPAPEPGPLLPRIVREGTATFTDWTLALALRGWQPGPAEWAALLPHLRSPSALVRASAGDALAGAARRHPGPGQQFLRTHQLTASLMSHPAAPAGHLSAHEQVQVLQRTALFAATPENVLSSIVPIMQEVTFAAGERVFAKGDLGASMFIVHAGTVDIFNGPQRLATFGPGDFFGELALLDAEPRSATAVAEGPVVAFRLDQEDFFDVMEERGEVLRNVLRVLCQRLRRQNDARSGPPAPAAPAQATTS